MGMAMFQKMQREMQKIQEELAKETVEATAGGGAVKASMTGQQKLVSVTIDPEVLDPDDVEMLQDLVVAAINDAITRSQELQAKRLSVLTGGLKIPGMM
jgi:DNA-binding YbaB/EbfC family protein